jgi:hypothetical protein
MALLDRKKVWGWVRNGTSSTDWLIVILTAVIAITSYLQWSEIHAGSRDTNALAEAARKQADKAETISGSLEKAVAEMKTSNAQAKQQSDQALRQGRDALNATIEQSKLGQRAWVGVSDSRLAQFEANKSIRVEITLTNSGNTPARDAHESTGYALSRIYLREPPKEATARLDKLLPQRSANPLPPQGRFVTRLGDIPPVGANASPEDLGGVAVVRESYDAIKSKVEILYVFGEYEYRDISGRSHTTRFCVFISDPDTKEVQFCDGFNQID